MAYLHCRIWIPIHIQIRIANQNGYIVICRICRIFIPHGVGIRFPSQLPGTGMDSESESGSVNVNNPLKVHNEHLKSQLLDELCIIWNLFFFWQVQAMTERTIRNDHPYRGLYIAWVGTMYYDYAEQVLAKGPNSAECSRMYNIAEQKLYEVCTTLI